MLENQIIRSTIIPSENTPTIPLCNSTIRFETNQINKEITTVYKIDKTEKRPQITKKKSILMAR